MKKVLLLALMALVSSGCAKRVTMGTSFFLQRGVVVQLTHTCTDKAMVYQAGRGLLGEIIGAAPKDIGLEPTIWGEQYVSATVQSINAVGKVLATFTERFSIDRRSTTTQTWEIVNRGVVGGGAGRRSYCPR